METLTVSFLSGSVREQVATLGVALVAVTAGVRLGVALVAVTAGVRLVVGRLGLQAGLTVLVLELNLPFRRLGGEYHASADGLAVAERVFALLDAPAAAWAGGSLSPPNPARAPVRLQHVCFSCPGRAGPVLDRLELGVATRETVALVGESGARKSTVARLLLGLLEPTGGRIFVGGSDLRACQPDAWRALVAWVPQHPMLFCGTGADNIRLGEAIRPPPMSGSARPPRSPARTSSSARCKAATRR